MEDETKRVLELMTLWVAKIKANNYLYDEALKQYQKSMEIKEKIGDIPGLAISMGQMGNLYLQKKEFANALEFFIQALLIFTKIGSPYAKKAKKLILETRENLPEKQFHDILKKFKLRPGTFS